MSTNLDNQPTTKTQKRLASHQYLKDEDTHKYNYIRGTTQDLKIDILLRTGNMLIGQCNGLEFTVSSDGLNGSLFIDMLPFKLDGFKSFNILVRKYTTSGCVELTITDITPNEMWEDDSKGIVLTFTATRTISWTPSLGDGIELPFTCANRAIAALETQIASIDTLGKAYASLTRKERKRFRSLMVDLLQEASADEFYPHLNDIDAHEVLIRNTKGWESIKEQRKMRLLAQRKFMSNWRRMNQATAEAESMVNTTFKGVTTLEPTKDAL